MTSIRANCPSCGDVNFKAEQLTVHVCTDTDEGSYSFRCPECAQYVAKPASTQTIGLLLARDVRVARWSLPLELNEPHVGAPLTVDEVIEFSRALRASDYPAVAAERSAT